jgi:ankyrin repeat protein
VPHASSAVSRLCLAAGLLLLAGLSAGAAADKPAANDPYTVSLPNGVTLQLFAVSASPSLDRPWWKPDGSAIDAPPYDHLGYRPYADQGKQCYELAVRVTGLPEEEELHRSVGDKEQYYVNGGGKPFAGDAQVEAVRAFTVYAEPAVAAATLSFRVAANQWKTLRTFKEAGVYGEGPDRVQVIKPERPGGASRPEDLNNPRFNVHMLNTDASLRLVAVDADGKAYPNKGSEWWGRDEHGVYAAFPDLPHERVKEYRLEACPYHPVVFADVKLKPADADAAAARAAKWRVDRLRAQEAKAGPDVALRVAGAMRALRSSRKAFDDADAWGRALRDVGEIGPPAVPALAAELNRSARPYVRSNMAIALRLVGDPRGVPGLATSLASTSFAPNDYGGLRFKDEKLKGYLARAVEMDRNGASFGRPVNEITNSLVALSGGHSEGDQHRMKNDLVLYQDASLKWSQWWEQNRAAALRGLPEQRGAFDAGGAPVDLLASLDGLEQKLKQAPALANETVAGEWTRLHVAALYGRLGEASLLLARGARTDAAAYGWTPLHLAAASGAPDVVNRLLEKGADVKATTPDGCTPLHAAVGMGLSPAYTRIVYQPEVEVVRLLLAKGADANAKDASGQTPMHGAAAFNDRGLTEVLLKSKADPRVADAQGRTPLHRAAECGASDVADALIAAGADVNAADKDGYGPIQVAGYSIHYKDFNPPMVPFLLARGAKVSTAALITLGTFEQIEARLKEDPTSASRPAPKTESDEAVTPLHLALSRKDMKIVRLLLDAGADPNAMNTGQTPLTWAAQQGNVELTRQLIAAKAKVDEAGKGQPTPLSWAALNKHAEVVRLLVEAGADVNSDGGGYLVWTPLNCALQVERGRGRGPDQTEEQAYQVAEYLLSKGANPNRQVENDGYTPIFGRGEKLGALLLKYGAKLDVRTKTGETPLHYACYFDDKQSAIRFLLAHKADVNARDEQRRTPLHACFRLNASPTIVELILKAGADPNEKDKDGRTPVHYAAEKGNAGVPVQVLAEILDSAAGTKADPNARDNDGATPLHLAAKLKHKEAIELLLSHGADPKAKDKSGKTPADWAEDEETKTLLGVK